jgi:hypothetical protein
LCVSASSTIIDPVPFHLDESGHPADGLLSARPRSYSSHAGHPRPATTTQHTKFRPHRPTLKASQLRPVSTLITASDITDKPNPSSRPRRRRDLERVGLLGLVDTDAATGPIPVAPRPTGNGAATTAQSAIRQRRGRAR